jgi:hypothetical protein
MSDFVEVKLLKDFLIVKETLTRIGVSQEEKNELYQSCHILHKKGKYYIVSFKEMFILDGKPSSFSEEDKARRNTIAKMLAEEYGLIEIIDKSKVEEPSMNRRRIKIIPYKEKNNWKLISKYTLGSEKKRTAVNVLS